MSNLLHDIDLVDRLNVMKGRARLIALAVEGIQAMGSTAITRLAFDLSDEIVTLVDDIEKCWEKDADRKSAASG